MKNRNNCRFGQISKVMNKAHALHQRSKGDIIYGCIYLHAYSVLFPWSASFVKAVVKKRLEDFYAY